MTPKIGSTWVFKDHPESKEFVIISIEEILKSRGSTADDLRLFLGNEFDRFVFYRREQGSVAHRFIEDFLKAFEEKRPAPNTEPRIASTNSEKYATW